jgi:hypothetical protein
MIKLKIGIGKQVFYVFQVAGKQVVHAYDMKAFGKEAVAEVRTQKAGSACNQYAFFHDILRVSGDKKE